MEGHVQFAFTDEQLQFRDIAARGIRGVEIADNIFTWGKQRTINICEGIAPLGLHWVCLARHPCR